MTALPIKSSVESSNSSSVSQIFKTIGRARSKEGGPLEDEIEA